MTSRLMKAGKILVYSKFDFINNPNAISEVQLDEILLNSWKKAEEDGVMKYRISSIAINTKLISLNKLEFKLTLNEKRFSDRRKPEQFSTLNDVFNGDKFNFNKVNKSEILLNLTDDLNSTDENLFLVNLSPFKFGHSLFVPDIQQCYNQFLRRKPLETALYAFMLSTQKNAVMGFNSLLAHASINHFHFHLWNNEDPLLSAKVPLFPIIYDKRDNKSPIVYQMTDHPVHNLVVIFETPDQIDAALSRFWLIIQCLQHHDCPHCVLFTREYSNDSTGHSHAPFTTRLIVWLRNKTTDEKLQFFQKVSNSESQPRIGDNYQFAVAVSELAGLINIGDNWLYNNITESTLKENFDRVRISSDVWENIITDIKGQI